MLLSQMFSVSPSSFGITKFLKPFLFLFFFFTKLPLHWNFMEDCTNRGGSGRQEGLARSGPWGHKESDTTKQQQALPVPQKTSFFFKPKINSCKDFHGFSAKLTILLEASWRCCQTDKQGTWVVPWPYLQGMSRKVIIV